jgi:anti-sigma factor RsiW
MEHLTVTQVNDYVDGNLTPAEREVFARHADECAPCRREIDAYQRVRSRLRALPADFVPPADVYDKVVAAARRGRLLTILARAAAVLLMTAGAALSVQLARRPAPGVPPRPASTAVVAPDASGSELALAYLAARDSLPPQAAVAIQRTIDSLDRAIDDTRAALRTYPGNGRLEARLARALQTRLRIMADAVNWSQAAHQGGAT